MVSFKLLVLSNNIKIRKMEYFMGEKIWKGLMAICMVICLVCPPLLVDAQKLDSEILQKEERDIPAEAFKGDTAIHDISDAYENVAQIEGGSETYISNTMNRAYEGSGQYGFALYATLDIENEINDTASNATEIDINEKITGAIDTPYDIDYYKFTLSSPVIMRITENLGNYKFSILAADNSTKVYKISEKDGMYQFNAGTYYFAVYSKDGTYSVDQDYKITANIIANIADNASSFYFTVNEKAKIVFQSDANGNNMYVNGNPIDINYDYHVDASTSAGTQKYDITMRNSSNLRAKVYQNQFMFEDAEETSYYGMVMPNTVNYISGTKGVGPAGNVLELSLYSVNSEKFYKVHCICSGAYAENNMYKDFNFTTVFINPNTGKLVDIQNINYFYDYATGSNSMLFTRPYSSSTKLYYPYFDGEEPLSW